MKRYAVLVDLQSERLGIEMFDKLIEEITRGGSVEYVKFYNYLAKRNGEFSSFIKEYGADIDLPMMSKKKVRIDMRQVIDAVRIASSNGNIDTFLLICSEVDGIYLVNELKKAGKRIEIAVTSSNSLSSKAHTEYLLDRFACVNESVANNGEKDGQKTLVDNSSDGAKTRERTRDGVKDAAKAELSDSEKEKTGERGGFAANRDEEYLEITKERCGYEDQSAVKKADNNIKKTVKPSDMYEENRILYGEGQREKEAIIASLKKVRGNESSIFPYSDIEKDDIDEKMAEIDRRLIKMINARKKESEESLNRLLGSELSDKDIEELIKKHLR